MKIVIDRGITIESLSAEEKKILKQHLTTPNTEYFNNIQFGRPVAGIDKYIIQYKEVGDSIIVPRGFLYQIFRLFGDPSTMEDHTARFDPINIPSKIQLKPLQIPWVDGLLTHRQGMGIAPPGSGKTIMSLQILSMLGQPALWLTHKKILVDQVIERIGSFMDVGTVGVLGDSKYTFGDIITVGMPSTLARRDLSEISQRFGIVIVDEAHHCSAPQLNHVICSLSPYYLYGLTATPFRSDKMEQVMFNTMGPIVISMNRQEAIKANNIVQPTVKARMTHFDNPNLHNTPNVGRIMKYVAKNKDRNKIIVYDLLGEIAEGNVCIVLVVTIKHGQILSEMLSELGLNSAHVHSKLKNKEALRLKEAFLKDDIKVLFATYNLIAEGFDHVITNRLFLAAPRCGEALIDQATGRIERVSEGKTDAIIYDYVDDIPMLKKQFKKRLAIYERKGIKVIY